MRPIFAFMSLVGFVLVTACSASPTPPTQPQVRIIAPPFGASFVQGETVGVQSVSTDPGGVTRVELYVDGKLANTKLADDPKGQTQLNAVQEWVTTNVGAHSLTVRAFNAANVPGEATIPVAVNPAQGAATATPTPTEPGATATPQVIIVTATAPPTEPPPTQVQVTPTPTLPPVTFLFPFDGGMHVVTRYDGGELFLQVTAHAGGEDGFDIDHVDMFVQDLNGKVISSHRENTAPYCWFGEANGDCNSVREGTNAFRWDASHPIQPGWYLIRGVAYSKQNKIRIDEMAVRITRPPDDLFTFFASILSPADQGSVDSQLEYQADISGAGADGQTGQGIARVDMFVIQFDGKIVSTQQEMNPQYCGFGDGGLNTPCAIWRFAEHGGKWQNGTPVYPTQYIVRVIAHASDGRIAAVSQMFQIDSTE